MSADVTQRLDRRRMRPLWLRVAERWASSLACGRVDVTLPNGDVSRFDSGMPGPSAEIAIHRPRFVRRLAMGGELGLAEAYIDGDWSSPDLTALLELGLMNHAALKTLEPSWPTRVIAKLRHWLNANTRRGSRRNIAYHYDLGNDFYASWLDSTMTYSSALFSAPAMDLASAQSAKYQRIVEKMGIAEGDSVLEIGCGWGGFAEHAARRGACVTGLTLSAEQAAFARERIAAAGLSDRVTIRLEDYRDVRGSYDHVVSVEMLEAVGEANWPGYFQTVRDRLRPGGQALIQVITVDDSVFDDYRRRVDFIQRYIFPGGMLLAPRALTHFAGRAGLSATDTFFFGADYAETLRLWGGRFEAAWPRIAALGFEERFRRLWTYYLHYCEATFRTGATNVCQFLVRKSPVDAAPVA